MVDIYALCDPDSKEVRYIGKANNAGSRLQRHLSDMKRRNTPLYSWMRKLEGSGKSPILKVIIVCGDDDWKAHEREAIRMARGMGVRLLNLAEGGDEPLCPRETRTKNGKKNAGKMVASRWHDPKKALYFELMNGLGRELAAGNVTPKILQKMRDRPAIFGRMLAKHDRRMARNG